MRVVLDTNILVSYLLWPASTVRPIVEEMIRHAEILRSTETFAELSEVVMRRKFDAYLPITDRELFLASFYDNSTHILISKRVEACRDPKDNKFLELGISGNAKIILTGDADLLALDPFQKIRIVSPAMFAAS